MSERLRLVLTRAELNHLYSVLCDAQAEGYYYGNRGQFYARHQRIMDKVLIALPDPTPPVSSLTARP